MPAQAPAAATQDGGELYKILQKEHIGPRLRSLGFRGSSGVYTKPDPAYFIRIGFQKSVYGTRRDVKFTLNISAIEKAGWENARATKDHLPAEPSANTYYGSAHWQRRIGQLMPDRDREPWWELAPGSDVTVVANEVLAVIENVALPAIGEATA
jgi:hypothetical protein